jgi:hypothetical protein
MMNFFWQRHNGIIPGRAGSGKRRRWA